MDFLCSNSRGDVVIFFYMNFELFRFFNICSVTSETWIVLHTEMQCPVNSIFYYYFYILNKHPQKNNQNRRRRWLLTEYERLFA